MKIKTKLLSYGLSLLTAGAALLSVTPSIQAADKKPNILIIWGDDIGMWNVGAYTHGMDTVEANARREIATIAVKRSVSFVSLFFMIFFPSANCAVSSRK